MFSIKTRNGGKLSFFFTNYDPSQTAELVSWADLSEENVMDHVIRITKYASSAWPFSSNYLHLQLKGPAKIFYNLFKSD